MQFSYTDMGIRKNADFGSRGSGGVICIVIIMKRIARKLRRIILLHFGLVAFRIHFWEIRQRFILMVFGPSGRGGDSQNQYHLSLETRILQIIQEQSQIISRSNICLEISLFWKSSILKIWEKTGADKSGRSSYFQKS